MVFDLKDMDWGMVVARSVYKGDGVCESQSWRYLDSTQATPPCRTKKVDQMPITRPSRTPPGSLCYAECSKTGPSTTIFMLHAQMRLLNVKALPVAAAGSAFAKSSRAVGDVSSC